MLSVVVFCGFLELLFNHEGFHSRQLPGGVCRRGSVTPESYVVRRHILL